MFELRFDVVSALTERWQSETHTFHLLCGKCTITLEDIALQLKLLVDGYAITGFNKVVEPVALCDSLLGRSSDDGKNKFTSFEFWLVKTKFQKRIEQCYGVGAYLRCSSIYYAVGRFVWMPYSASDVAVVISQWGHAHSTVWCINVSVLNFLIVKWYKGDRFLQQFDCKQRYK
ncbi:hypothetical protein PVK06_032032 [Gossypium arboreum]|uniref:Aminotransferase-like plant mobile domain-containing protein n=1 Tax=Gossypium arboreum TaxID=29729 RepID=A0ABR0NW26_GOSAR|nr:hypothetical protein PVK06_032032 [Gossypium arboreum]